ncbi:MAG: GvpL/GvpF family gas vesicle protein [Thermoleophilia bacterium]|nr:GvpL/GvpF family gas vesicle protein [Thermoleophilia bacterium]
MGATYLYGIVPTNECVTVPGDGVSAQPGGIHTVPYNDIAAVVGPSDLEDYSGMGREDLVRVLLGHQRVVEQVMRAFPVLPAKFSTVLAGEDRVVDLLAQGHDLFLAELDRLEGCAQMEVLVQWDLGDVFADLGQDERVARLRADAETASPERVKELQILAGRLVQALLEEKRAAYQARLSSRLREPGIEMLSNPCMDDSMVMNVALLANEAGRGRLDALLPKLDEEFEGRLTFRCIGPLPPYSFATLELEFPIFSDIDRARRLLELPEVVTARQVKESYHRLAARFHPDRNPSLVDGVDTMSDLSWAYGLLTRFVESQVERNRQVDRDDRRGTGGGKLRDVPCPLDVHSVERALLFDICRQETPVG